MNIIDYVKKSKTSFLEKELNEVDSLVFSQLAYVNFCDKSKKYFTYFKDIEIEDVNFKEVNKLAVGGASNEKLVEALKKSNRFKDAKILEQVIINNSKVSLSATLFLLPTDEIYLAFRGSEGNLVSWVDNLELIYHNDTPVSLEALKYGEEVLSKYSNNIYLGGHSKGGYLALYTGLYLKDKKRIIKIFNHDGPGFILDMPKSFDDIKDRYYKTITNASVFGLLMNKEKYKVVYSDGTVIVDHLSYNWVVEKDHFEEAKLSPRAKKINKGLEDFVKDKSEEEREKLVNTIYKVVKASGERKFTSILKTFWITVPKMILEAKDLSEEEKSLAGESIKLLYDLIVKS